MAFVGYSFSNYYADPSIDDRGQHRAIIGVSHQFNNRVVGSLFYQFSYSDFHNVERRDYRNLLGATASYQFTRGIFGVFTTSFVDNDSSQDFASYQSFNLSLGVNVQF
jgi:hypothetical protein